MKIKKLTSLIPLITCVTCLSGCTFFDNLKDLLNEEEQEEEDEITNDVEKLKAGYYKSINFDSPRILQNLQELCFEKHKVYITYGQYNSYCSNTKDHKSIENVPGTTLNQYFYSGKEASGYGTREHVWPCANSASLWVHGDDADNVHNVDKSYYVGGGSDLYHVRTANSMINTARGNSRFCEFSDDEFESIRSGVVEVSENKGKYPLLVQGATKNSAGTYQYADKCEVDDEMKGDVARIIVYVWTHYTDRGVAPDGSYEVKSGKTTKKYPYADMCGKLSFPSIMGYGTMERCAEKLIEWNKIDPPSDVEKQRNNTVQKIQGNRNPYVDFPELVDAVLDQYLEE